MTKKYKPFTVYLKEKQYKQLLKHIGSQAFSKWVRAHIEQDLLTWDDAVYISSLMKKKK